MCSKCQDILIGFSIPHPVSSCPLSRSQYCSYCCCYGHLTKECTEGDAKESRDGPSTPLPIFSEEDIRPSRFQPVLEVEETDRAIRQVLMNYSIQPSGKMKENRRLLKEVAEQIGRKLVYLKPN